MAVLRDRVPVLAPDTEAPTVRDLDAVLADSKGVAKLILPSGEEIELPHSVFAVLARVVHEMAQGNAVRVMPVYAELTTQHAANLLNVSRPFLVKLLEEGEIPYKKVGTHRRIRLEDPLVYKEHRDGERLRLLDEMASEAQEQSLYDD
jgi:excisionase family DNA binding protein